MSKVLLSLNFMYCMERFATQIYRIQKGAFNDGQIEQKLKDASENESGHVQKLQRQIKQLNGKVYPFGFLFQSMGAILGFITRMCGKGNLLKADTFVETRAVRDYSSFLKSVRFDSDTVVLIKKIISDEEVHIINWKKAKESLAVKRPDSS